MPLGVSEGKSLNAQLTLEEQQDHKADTIFTSVVLKLNSNRNQQHKRAPRTCSRGRGWSAQSGAYRESQRSVSIRVKIEFLKLFVCFVSFPRSESLERLLPGHRVFFKLVVIHSLTHFLQEVGQESLGLGQGDLRRQPREACLSGLSGPRRGGRVEPAPRAAAPGLAPPRNGHGPP